MRFRWLAAASGAVLLALAAAPLVLTRDLVTALFLTFVFFTVAANYDIVGGFLRQINLGQGAYFGLAAYLMAVVLARVWGDGAAPQLVLAIALAIALTAAFAALVSYPLFRVRGAYFAVITFGLVLMLQQVVLNTRDLSGGSYGVTIPSRYYVELDVAYWAALLIAWSALLLNALIARSRLGLALHALRDSQAAASAIGIDPLRYKRLALVISSVPTAAAGCVYALYVNHIYVETVLGLERTLLPVVMAMLGGSGHVLGPLLGAAIVQGIDLGLRYVELPLPALAVYGMLLAFIGLFLPGGIVSAFSRGSRAALRSAAPET